MSVLVERRMALLRVSPQVLIDICKPGRRAFDAVTPLPADAVFLGVDYDYERRAFAITVASSTYAIVADGERLPEITCAFATVEL